MIDPGLIAVIMVPISAVATTLLQIYRENRNRKWDREDREYHASRLMGKLVENTELTKEIKVEAAAAYKEANTVNKKLETIGVKMADGKPLDQPNE